ncbi:MAG: response regulator [Negativicutes bacterium]|nr:response regulator [Negativicutes bacterium]
MAAKIRVLIADDIQATRDNIRKLTEFHPEIAIAGEADSAEAAIAKAKEVQPDVILMDINMPGMDGISATSLLSTEVPQACIIIMSVQGEKEYLRRAMTAGAKDYLTKPFSGDELLQAIKQAYTCEQQRRKVVNFEPKEPQLGKVITVFSAKGGTGKTTIATNLAVALAAKTRGRTCIVDADLQFGDVSLFLNIVPRATIADLVADVAHLDDKVMAGYLTKYNDQVDVLAAPLRPEQAETVSSATLSAVFKTLRTMYQYIIVDTTPTFSETMLTALDDADQILVVASLDLPTIKNVKLCLEIMESLNYSPDKIKLVLNRANSEGGMDIREAEESLRQSFTASLPSDGKMVVSSVNRGTPFVVSNPEAVVSQNIFKLAKSISAIEWPQEQPRGMVYRLKRLLG